MVAKRSAGILVYRRTPETQVLIGRMGGPFWAKKTEHSWSIPKGEYTEGETALDAARREFTEELGLPVPDGPLTDLGTITASGKQIRIWALAADPDLTDLTLGTFELEWPPRSGRLQSFPELAEVAWSGLDEARLRLVKGQLPFLDRLAALTDGATAPPDGTTAPS